MSAGAHDVAAAIAAHGLQGTLAPLPDAPLGGEDWAVLMGRVRAERMPGLLVAAIGDGALPATAQQAAEASQAHMASMCTAVLLERDLLEAVDLLDAAGIPCRVLKGSAVAHLDYPDPALRSFGDLDLLVPPEHFDHAVELFVGRGDHRQFLSPRPDFDRRFSKGTSFITPFGRDLDLHRTFVSGPFGLTVELPDLFGTASPFSVGGRTVLALGPEERFLHACFHAALGDIPPRLVALRDVAQILLHTPLSEERVREQCRRWRAEPVVARAVSLAWETLRIADVVALSVWAGRYRLDPAQRRAIRVYTDAAATYPAQAATALWAIPRLSDRAAYLRALLFPDRSYLAPRDRSYATRIRRGLSTLVQWGVRT